MSSLEGDGASLQTCGEEHPEGRASAKALRQRVPGGLEYQHGGLVASVAGGHEVRGEDDGLIGPV